MLMMRCGLCPNTGSCSLSVDLSDHFRLENGGIYLYVLIMALSGRNMTEERKLEN